MNDLIFNELDYEELAMIASTCIHQMVERLKANADLSDRYR